MKSRNEREGHYMGWRVLGPSKRGMTLVDRKKPGHQRIGNEIMVVTLKQRVKAAKKGIKITGRY